MYATFLALATSYYSARESGVPFHEQTDLTICGFHQDYLKASRDWFQGAITEFEISPEGEKYGFPIQCLPPRKPEKIDEFIAQFFPDRSLPEIQDLQDESFLPASTTVQKAVSKVPGYVTVSATSIKAVDTDDKKLVMVTDGRDYRSFFMRPADVKVLLEANVVVHNYYEFSEFIVILTKLVHMCTFPKTKVFNPGSCIFTLFRCSNILNKRRAAHYAVSVVTRNTQLLAIHRNSTPTVFKECYSLPGGKVDSTDSILSAVKRETEEETGIILTEPVYKFSYRHEQPGSKTMVHFFFQQVHLPCTPVNLEPNKAHSVKFYHYSDFDNLPCVPSLALFLNLLRRTGRDMSWNNEELARDSGNFV